MYPNLYYAFEDLFGIRIKGLQLVNSFGFFVAIAFLIGAWVLTRELRRKEQEGVFSYTTRTIISNQQVSWFDVILNFLLGFFLGYKIIGAFLIDQALDDPQAFIFSSRGHLVAGLLAGLFFGGLKWNDKRKSEAGKPEKRTIRVWPHDRVGDIVIYAAIFGFLGAKIFHNLENLDEFSRDPIGSLISFSGLTIYGGLLLATAAIIYYARKHNIGVLPLADAFAPTMMIAYAIGRIGCQVSGDGDWGIVNSAYITQADGTIAHSGPGEFDTALQSNAMFYMKDLHVQSVADVHYASVTAPGWLPDWLLAYNYPNNVISSGVPLPDCAGKYCNVLPIPVFPTPLYEFLACTLLFFILWALRKKLKVAGRLAAIYLVMNGVERFLIEKIRINNTYNMFGFHPTQAEIISSLLVVAGVVLYVYAPRLQGTAKPDQSEKLS
ncbi:MAG TPA: prolipoprotein diacylglyceryl transferase family protein [Chitinophagaceae bacterium]